jgi:catechol 2,3-dioxygenase-like lactoylglutathione lyase family enzyme
MPRQLPSRLHHFAFTVRDQEANRRFFEDLLGLPLVATWCEKVYNPEAGRELEYCHTFFALGDGGALAFFQFSDPAIYEKAVPAAQSRFRHIALKVDRATFDDIERRLKDAAVKYRVTDHGYCLSLYVESPDELKVEFTVDPEHVAEIEEMRRADAHSELKRWLAGDHTPNNTDRSK